MLVSGRIKNLNQDQVGFTPAMAIEDLLKLVQEKLPCDKLYVCLPQDDGSFTYAEIGSLVIDFVPNGSEVSVKKHALPSIRVEFASEAPSDIVSPTPEIKDEKSPLFERLKGTLKSKKSKDE